MNSWSNKRKLLYATSLIVFLILAFGIPSFLLFYKAPTCSDGKQNGSEKGVDCGGKCSRLCQSDFSPPSVSWTRFEQVVPGVYNVSAYIINPNKFGEARNTPFHMSLYDKNGMLITDKTGSVTIPPSRNTLAFIGLIRVENSIPAKVLFEFTSNPNWVKKDDTLKGISILEKDYREDPNGSYLRVPLKNEGLYSVKNLGVYVILKDKDNNVIGFSKTIIDEIEPKETVVAPFTWNTNRNKEVVSIEVLYVAE